MSGWRRLARLAGRIGLVAVLGGAGGPSCKRDDVGGAVPTVIVKRSPFVRAVDADGYLKPVETTIVSAPSGSSGPKRISWLAADGIAVKKGDVVARFDATELRESLLAAEEDRTSTATRTAKESLLVSQARNERHRTTEAALRELKASQSFQRKDTAIYSRDDIITSEIDHTLQNARADHARKAQGVDAQIARRKLQILEVEGKKVAEAIGRAKEGLETLEARAPHDGVVVFTRNWRGDTMAVGDQAWGPLAEVSRSDQIEVEVFVLEAEAAGLTSAKGRKAEVVLESRPELIWKGEIKRVEPVAKRRQFRSPTQYFGVTLALEKIDPALMKPGQRVRARLFLDQQEAIVVPRPALFQKDGRWIAYRREGNRFVETKVKLGTATPGLVVVESGLAAGDAIALRDPGQSLTDILSIPAGAAAGKTP